MNTAQWKPVPHFEEQYEISDHGCVVRIATHGLNPIEIRRELRPHRKPNGYLAIDLNKQNQRERAYVHRLVWFAFRGIIPAGFEINHRNGIRDDNRLENLELITRSDNMVHGHRTMGKKSAKLTENDVRQILQIIAARTMTYDVIAERYGVSQSNISHIASGRNWKRIPRKDQT